MTIDRRSLIGVSLGLGAAVTTAHAAERRSSREAPIPNASEFSGALAPDDHRDQTATLQAAIDAAAEKDIPLVLPLANSS